MYTISKRMEISAAHRLALSYDSPCSGLHGHNWIITVFCRARELNADGMVEDFAAIKRAIHGKLDHKDLNDALGFNPTAENLARWIVERVPHCFKATVRESEGNEATYERDE